VSLLGLLLLAVALAMDCTAVALASGLAVARVEHAKALRMGVFFGGFQAGMPAIGYAAGAPFVHLLAAYDHWIAFALLAAVGGKMLHEAFSKDDDAPRGDPFATRTLLVLSVATSIDALAVGLTFPLLGVSLGPAVAIIGVVSFVFSVVGVHVGRRVGERFGRKLDIAAGLVLIGIGTKILVQHLVEG